MKNLKIFYSAVLMFTIAICLVSCQKENSFNPNELKEENSNLSIDGEADLLERAQSVSNCHYRDFEALFDFYHGTNGPNWPSQHKLGWEMFDSNGAPFSGCDLSDINDVSLNENGRVRYLHRSGGQYLNGTLNSSLGQLDEIEVLKISYHRNLTGPIPPELGQLSELEFLNLGANSLSGDIPGELGNLENLRHFYLWYNDLSGCYDSNLKDLCYLSRTYRIDRGNNFPTSFSNFCNSDAGACVPN